MRQALAGKEKAAILLISLGPELSAQVLKHMREDQIEELTLEIAGLKRVEPELRDKVLEEFHQLCLARECISQGGITYAREVLEQALGTQRALDIINRLTASLQVRPFDFARKTDAGQLLNFIQNEHPQTIALVAAYLQPEQAAAILSALPPEKQIDVAKRMALMDSTSPDIVLQVEQVLERKLSTLTSQEYARAGGVESIVKVLNAADRGTEKTILEALEREEPELAEEIKRRLFTFEDIIQLDDRAVMRVLREVNLNHDLPLALKVASDEVRHKIFKNMSKRAVETLQEEIGYLGPVRLRDVEDAQQKIVNIVRKLEESGEIVIVRGGEDELVV
ncbi:MAG TPA: flagellar motor switch protein FliG [Firmicutes bacterium]|uniref:flagellar motor switch protein FliG n=1 Tax=Gelria sp. Kuro-4 TaxID=2796927 RepID=UPI0019B6F6AB|nr:flagellar motor switch protein FliG [Gelria sp. Kuro-4]BCV24921.1 flagellar motor switch protein FliG [Gelria sp. Kuro-4]HHV58582.1 flagellar motor switch protein FliG [Bacillota bacterium]